MGIEGERGRRDQAKKRRVSGAETVGEAGYSLDRRRRRAPIFPSPRNSRVKGSALGHRDRCAVWLVLGFRYVATMGAARFGLRGNQASTTWKGDDAGDYRGALARNLAPQPRSRPKNGSTKHQLNHLAQQKTHAPFGSTAPQARPSIGLGEGGSANSPGGLSVPLPSGIRALAG